MQAEMAYPTRTQYVSHVRTSGIAKNNQFRGLGKFIADFEILAGMHAARAVSDAPMCLEMANTAHEVKSVNQDDDGLEDPGMVHMGHYTAEPLFMTAEQAKTVAKDLEQFFKDHPVAPPWKEPLLQNLLSGTLEQAKLRMDLMRGPRCVLYLAKPPAPLPTPSDCKRPQPSRIKVQRPSKLADLADKACGGR